MKKLFRLLTGQSILSAYGQQSRPGAGCNPRIVIGILFIIGAVVYNRMSTTEYQNEFTGRTQLLAIATPEEEVAMGLQSAPGMVREMGGLSSDPQARALVESVGRKLIESTAARETPYQYKFHLLADPQTINAFALPGGQIFITEALFRKLKNEDQLAGVLGHEMGHVVGRHSNEQMAHSQKWSGIGQGVAILLSDTQGGANTGQMIGQMLTQWKTTKFSRDDELESDALGVRFMLQAGYQPEELIGVMEILAEAGGGRGGSDFMSTHPTPENRMDKIKEAIAKERSLLK